LYLVYGEEAYWHEKIIALLAGRFLDGTEYLSGDDTTWADLRDFLSQPSFFGPRLWVVRGAKELLIQTSDAWIEVIAPGNSLLLSSITKENPASRQFNQFLKKAGGKVIQASQPSFAEAASWVRNKLKEDGFTISRDALDSLILIVGRSIERLEKEVEKLELYVSETPSAGKDYVTKNKERLQARSITDWHVLECVSPDPEMNTFALVDAVAARNAKGAFSEVQELFARGVNTIFIIAVLGSHFGLMYRAKEAGLKGSSPDSLGRELGVHPYAGKKALAQSANWTFPEIERAICLLCEVDEAIKSGKTDPTSAMDYVLVELMKR
jgi:DNA polymerase III delta subunit